MIRVRKFVLACVLIAAINIALRATDQGFTDMEAYLPPKGRRQAATPLPPTRSGFATMHDWTRPTD
ncbi:MAG: hypothetical protein ACR2IV_00895 [Bryobacteraceae bacterium]